MQNSISRLTRRIVNPYHRGTSLSIMITNKSKNKGEFPRFGDLLAITITIVDCAGPIFAKLNYHRATKKTLIWAETPLKCVLGDPIFPRGNGPLC